MRNKDEEFNDFMKNYFFNQQQHHNAYGAYDFDPIGTRRKAGKTGHSFFDNADYVYEHKRPAKPEGVISIIHTPPKVKPESYSNKSRRFRKDLNVEAIGLTTQLDRASIVGFHVREVLVLKVNGVVVEVSETITKAIRDGVYIIPNIEVIKVRRLRHNSKRISLTHLFYLCIVESQYIQFEEV